MSRVWCRHLDSMSGLRRSPQCPRHHQSPSQEMVTGRIIWQLGLPMSNGAWPCSSSNRAPDNNLASASRQFGNDWRELVNHPIPQHKVVESDRFPVRAPVIGDGIDTADQKEFRVLPL